jgi:hypothetical protein
MSTKKTIQIQKNETPERHLIDAANILIEGFKKPTNLLEFLTRSFWWIELYSDEKKDNGRPVNKNTYPSVLMIEQIVQPWLKNDGNVVLEVSKGIKQIWDHFHYEGYFEYLAIITQGFGIDTYDSPFIPEKMKLYLSAINTMHEAGYCIEAYENEINRIREIDKSSKAA